MTVAVAPRPANDPGRGFSGMDHPPASRWVVPIAFIAFSILMAVTSRGFLEADEITHFLKARGVWYNWVGLTDIWGRLGCTGLYCLMAPLGFTAARLLAAGVTTLTCLGTGILVRHFVATAGEQFTRNSWFGRHAVALAWLLLFAQPFFALNCFTVMTEMLLACVWVWTAVVLIRRRNRPGSGIIAASVVLGLGGLMRPEGWIAMAVWPVFALFWLRRRAGREGRNAQDKILSGNGRLWRVLAATLVAGLPSLAWYLLGAAGRASELHPYGDWRWVISAWPWAVKDIYQTSAMLFFEYALAAMAVWMWGPIVVGLLGFRRRASRQTPRAWRVEGWMLLGIPLGGLFLVHGVLGSFHLFGSMALPRYYISVAPMAAVLAVLGLMRLERLFTGGRGAMLRSVLLRPVLLRAAVAMLPLATLMGLVSVKLLPMAKSADMRRLDVAIGVLQRRVPADEYRQRIIAGNPYVILALGLPPGTPVDGRANAAGIADAPVGTLLVTDSNLWVGAGHPGPEQLDEWGYAVDPAVAARADAVGGGDFWVGKWMRAGKVRLWVKGVRGRVE